MPTSPPPSPPADTNIDHAKALAYWSSIPPDINGMLGGYPQISPADIRGSRAFVAKLRRASGETSKEFTRGVDCGAGIGRITISLLTSLCSTTDVVEPIAKFTAHILSDASFGALRANGKVGTVYTQSLESWDPSSAGVKYDLVWNQWCLGHLTDAQLVAYLKRCVQALAEGGWVVVKENMSTDKGGEDIFDQADNSVTRADKKFRSIFAEAGLRVVRTELQKGFPKGLYPVRMYALQPAEEQR